MTERPRQKEKKDPFKEAMKLLDEYYEGTPKRSTKVDEGGE